MKKKKLLEDIENTHNQLKRNPLRTKVNIEDYIDDLDFLQSHIKTFIYHNYVDDAHEAIRKVLSK